MASRAVNVFIEYCGYYSRFMMQVRALRELAPSVKVDGDVGRGSSFEVIVDDKYVAFSKLATRNFPDYAAVAREIAEYASTGKPADSWKSA